MGGSRWSDESYISSASLRASTGKSAFAYTAAMDATPVTARKVNDRLNPKGVKFRESRDSDVHPTSKAIVVMFDVTGSMSSIPRLLQQKLPALMALVIQKGVPHPQIMYAAVGDATSDRVPLQVGQFESGNEMEHDLEAMYLEGGGGGQKTESYELGAYFLLKHTSIDCLEKRGEKGYCFFIGDEMPYPNVSFTQVQELIGDKIEAATPTSEVFRALQEMYEVFFIIPTGASHSGDKEVKQTWQDILGQNVMLLEDVNAVAETIAATIAVCEGKIDPDNSLGDLKDMGVDSKTAGSVSKALVKLKPKSISKSVLVGAGLAPIDGSDDVSRL